MIWAEIVREFQEEPGQMEEGVLWASVLPYCSRKILLRGSHDWIEPVEKVERETDSVGAWNIGTFIHAAVEEVVRRIHPEANIELPGELIVSESIVRYRTDIIYKDEHGPWLLEIKTFAGSSRYDATKYLPKEDHIQQLAIQAEGTQIYRAKLLYIDRNTGKGIEYIIPKDRLFDAFRKVVEKVRYIEECIRKRKIPPAKPLNRGKLDWECQYCEFRKACWQYMYTCPDCQANDRCDGCKNCRVNCQSAFAKPIRIREESS